MLMQSGRVLSIVNAGLLKASCSLQRPRCKKFCTSESPPKDVRRALIVTKLSRYEFEQGRRPQLTEDQLAKVIRDRGTNFDRLVYHHEKQKNFERTIVNKFKAAGVDVKVANRNSLNNNLIKWADILVPVGGDGTFLLSAGRASPLVPEIGQTPVVGFNSDPHRSEGRLMLPAYYSHYPEEAIKKILKGEFKWLRRSRIRVTLLNGPNGNKKINSRNEIVDLHEHSKNTNVIKDDRITKISMKNGPEMLPHLALNEVFIGESVSARVSHLHMKFDDGTMYKTKSSGLCVSTGTGSTSWHTSINRLSSKNVNDLLKILQTYCPAMEMPSPMAVSEDYNHKLVFKSDDPRMGYSIREQICVGVWPKPKGLESRGFVRSLLVESRCLDANMVIDGGVAYPFNDGAKALLAVHPEDALLTIMFD